MITEQHYRETLAMMQAEADAQWGPRPPLFEQIEHGERDRVASAAVRAADVGLAWMRERAMADGGMASEWSRLYAETCRAIRDAAYNDPAVVHEAQCKASYTCSKLGIL